ncbi:hypothetical protein AMATHDRAFT_77384 [Amanita thiersii Skay4041]|uniref:Calcium-channel protein CCH1 n=1 Tax=Amanita thiersii Skay4041 TaxID=703135 RepID=A0A2A9NGZ3_9AGAR|nr:hypothetical protein AMATHDRAFT_77384 [Amanita thiersii Skay4041]
MPVRPSHYALDDDPFYSPTEYEIGAAATAKDIPPSSSSSRYGRQNSDPDSYSTSQAALSTASLISTNESEAEDGHREDDKAALTQNMSHGGHSGADAGVHCRSHEGWIDSGDTSSRDPERSAGLTPRSRRRTARYSVAHSPLKKTGTAIKSMSKSLRRVSLRVVNIANNGSETQLRLGEDDDDDAVKRDEDDRGEDTVQEQTELRRNLSLRGRTLGCLGPESGFRLTLYRFLVHKWTEPFILLLIAINALVLTFQASRSVTVSDSGPLRIKGYLHTWEDYVLFLLFIIYTLEALARICVSGFLFDPEIHMSSMFSSSFYQTAEPFPVTPISAGPSSITRQPSLSRGPSITRALHKIHRTILRPFTLAPRPRAYTHSSSPPNETHQLSRATEKLITTSQKAQAAFRDPSRPTYFSNIMKSESDNLSLPFRLSVKHMHDKTRRNVPYLRHSWSRIDFVAIMSFWISFGLAMLGLERGTYHIGIFRAMSVIRCARLLAITSGTTTIMHSLKTARPLLASVAYFVLFAMILFSIIGVQAFRGSLRRSCWLTPIGGEEELELGSQFCGGHINSTTFQVSGYVRIDGSIAPTTKGFICPLGQLCKAGYIPEADNPNNDVESFDTIYNAALQIIIISSANGWSPLMYAMADAEFFVSCIFFIVCIVVLNFWLINLFVAVITNTFSAIRTVTKKSAFGAAPLVPSVVDEHEESWPAKEGRKSSHRNMANSIHCYTKWCWVLLALASLVLQATRRIDTDSFHEDLIYYGELGITLAFDFEIVLRFLATFPDWRCFFIHGNNWLDLILAVGSSVIQIPTIRWSSIYPWFTVFQLARFYRVILVVPRMKPLLLAVFGNMYGLVNMSLFLILVNYLAALVAVQLLRGDLKDDDTINFGDVYNAFLGVYQIFSSENWTDLLYSTAGAEAKLGQTVIVLLFLSSWMLFANFIVLQMFIAVINENFSVAEELKKSKQASKYWATQEINQGKPSWTRKLNPYRWMKANPVTVKVDNLPSNLVLPMQKSLVQDNNRVPGLESGSRTDVVERSKPRHYSSKSLSALQRLFTGETRSNDIPLMALRHARNETLAGKRLDVDGADRPLALLASINVDGGSVEDLDDAIYERRAQKADFIRNHPSYDKTFWIFSQKHVLRKMCQKLVQPANGERIFGTACSPVAHPIFQLVLLLTVIGGIVVESIANPLYRRDFYMRYGYTRGAWFDIAESAFGFTLLVEFLIKVIADGFLFTPSAYVRSIWNILDFFIMIGLFINVTTGLIFVGGLSRLTRSLKALRALRLITLIDRMRYTFQSLIISGAVRIFDAAILAILYMIPYAVWGLNIFAGKMNQCNDGDVTGMGDCIDEFTNNVYENTFGFLAPRVWDNPAPSTVFSFDTFRASLLILFEIVSLEGWIDVMGIATSITGENKQPQTNASPANAIFFLVYHLVGGVVILTLFVSIIIGNFSSTTGSAYLTKPQREWIDLQKLFKRQRPSKRPKISPTGLVRSWCFDRALHKHGWWSRGMTVLIVLHIIALMTQSFAANDKADRYRNIFFLIFTATYIIDVAVRSFGLGWSSYSANGWNVFDVFVSCGSFITTLIVQAGASGYSIEQLQKLFLVSIAFKLVQRTNSLNMLFKTAVASLPAILSLLGLWLILFIFFGILFVEVFSMTKWGSGENRNQNYSSLGSALVMLAFMSTGEGWNQYMHDFDIEYPRCTNSNVLKSESDCGSTSWAFALFIAWNLLSMYIFVNMFTGVVVESFSYVFQSSEGGARSITREQMRAFKKVWAEYADPKTGHLLQNQFGCFFSRLTGVFEVRIYPIEQSISSILSTCMVNEHSKSLGVVKEVDIRKLKKILNKIDTVKIRKRKAIYSRLYHEACISHQGEGISFTGMLLLLAHHKLIIDAEALILKDLVVRTETNQLVTDLVNLDRVKSLLEAYTVRRRYLAMREQLTRSTEIPSIIVDVMPGTPPQSSRDISSALYDSAPNSANSTPSVNRRYSTAPDVSFALEDAPRLYRSPRRTSDFSMLSADLGYRSPRTSFVDDDPQVVLSSINRSLWGELMQEATEEEERRS